MKKLLLLLIVAIFTLTTAFDANAKWTDRNTFGLKGPVKAVDGNNLCFEEDGTLYLMSGERIIIDSRDKLGRITSLRWAEMPEFYEYVYNPKGQLIKESYSGGTGMDESIIKYTYNAKEQIIKQNENGYITTYTYQAFDSYGNWTKRTAITGKKRTVETRTITYYSSSQKPTIPSDIVNKEAQNSKNWIVKNKDSKFFHYDSYEKAFSDETSNATQGEIINGVKIGNYIYDCDDYGEDYIYVYNAADCVPATTSNFIPLSYGGANGTRLSDGSTLYIVPFNPGKYTISGAKSKSQLIGTYVMVFENPNWKEPINGRCYTAVVNITKTNKGYCLTNAYGIYGKDLSAKNIVSKTGALLKNAKIEKGEQDMICEPKWVVEFPGLIERGIPIGFVTK